jgi:hypothetical protein
VPRPGERPPSQELLAQILELAGTEMILVGGQALAFWAAYYNVPASPLAVTRDVDFVGSRTDVERLACGLDARATFRRQRDLTMLVGQVEKELQGGGYINIDVLFGVYGSLSTEDLTKRSLVAASPAGNFRIMHPLDLLQGRLENVCGLREKQDEHGIAQLHLAIAMAREFLRDITSQEADRQATNDEGARPASLRHLRRVESLALSDAGRKVAKRYQEFVADAIDPLPLLHLKPFATKKLPQLMKLMSAEWQRQLIAARTSDK